MSDQVIIKKAISIAKGETKLFENSDIHLKAIITCAGKLEFNHCTMHYNEYRFANGIELSSDASLSFKDCSIICDGLDDDTFIRGDGCEQLSFENCTFKDCSNFLCINLDGITRSFNMSHCQLVNCFDKFISVDMVESATSSITDTKIVEDDVADFNQENGLFCGVINLIKIHVLDDGLTCTLANNTVEEKNSFKRAGVKAGLSDNEIAYFDVENAEIKQCSFLNANNCIALNNGKITDCKFTSCCNVIASNNCSPDKALTVDSCHFDSCTLILSTCLNYTATNCSFTNCYGRLIMPGNYDCGSAMISSCTFNNIKYMDGTKNEDLISGMPCSLAADDSMKFYGVDACITFSFNDEDGKANQMFNCTFDGAELGEDIFLIQSVGNVDYDALLIKLHRHKPHGKVAYIKDCTFKNITTHRSTGKIIKEYVPYDTTFKKGHNFKATIVSDCNGLDNVQMLS